MAGHTKSKVAPNAFEIDARISMQIELELAYALGNLILETDTPNTALLALGHQLRSIRYGKSSDSPQVSDG